MSWLYPHMDQKLLDGSLRQLILFTFVCFFFTFLSNLFLSCIFSRSLSFHLVSNSFSYLLKGPQGAASLPFCHQIALFPSPHQTIPLSAAAAEKLGDVCSDRETIKSPAAAWGLQSCQAALSLLKHSGCYPINDSGRIIFRPEHSGGKCSSGKRLSECTCANVWVEALQRRHALLKIQICQLINSMLKSSRQERDPPEMVQDPSHFHWLLDLWAISRADFTFSIQV